MTYSFTRTRLQVANLVLGKLDVLAAGGTALSADTDLVFEALDLRLKEIHRLGIVWRKVDPIPLSFTLTADTASASATADILFPIRVTVVDGSNDEPVEIISKRQYAGIYNKSQGGTPTKVLWEGPGSAAKFTFWPVQEAATTAKLTYEKFMDDTSHGSAPDVDVAMLRPLSDVVLYDVADFYGVDEQKITRLQKAALMAERQIRALAVERVDYGPVKVEQWADYEWRKPSDYDW